MHSNPVMKRSSNGAAKLMNEPIASRSHFSISFDATRERRRLLERHVPRDSRYQIQDAGSKWGTFLKAPRPR